MKYSKLRRSVLFLSLLAVMLMATGAYGSDLRVQTLDEPLGQYAEAPQLAELVAAGELPPVEERLPSNPPIQPVAESIGQYGGTLNQWWASPHHGIAIWTFWDGLFLPTRDGEVMPNLAAGYEYNEDATSLTIHLREGVKWSDGEPYTADDFLFWWEDYMTYSPDPEAPLSLPPDLQPGGEPMQVTKVDDYTVRLDFAIPHPMFIYVLAVNQAPRNFWGELPKHALMQYHPRYNDDPEVDPDELYSEFLARANHGWLDHIDLPTLRAWKLSRRMPGDRYIFERNPYYWKVDAEGNQLPYLDQVVFHEVADSSVAHVQATQGRFDLQLLLLDPGQLPVLFERQEQGNYAVDLVPQTQAEAVFLNWHARDERLRDLIRTREFRIALALGMDREEIWELAYNELGKPGRTFVDSYNPLWEDPEVRQWAEMHTEFDPDTANQMLDDLGLERGPDGFRRYPDGDRIEIIMTVLADNDVFIRSAEIIRRNWDDLGIQTFVNTLERGTYISRINEAQEHEATIVNWNTDLFPFIGGHLFLQTGAWVAGLSNPIHRGTELYREPPELIAELMDLHRQAYWEATTDEERWTAAKEAMRIHAENVIKIGLMTEIQRPILRRNDLHNYPFDLFLGTPQLGWQGVIPHEQLFSTRGE